MMTDQLKPTNAIYNQFVILIPGLNAGVGYIYHFVILITLVFHTIPSCAQALLDYVRKARS